MDNLDAKLQEYSFSLDKVMCICRESIETSPESEHHMSLPSSANCLPPIFMATDHTGTVPSRTCSSRWQELKPVMQEHDCQAYFLKRPTMAVECGVVREV